MQYDLEARTKEFAKNMIEFIARIKIVDINRNIISQLLRSATSVGANYCEANAASSKSDFRNKIFICRKEIQETKYWIELLAKVQPLEKEQLRKFWQEAHELTLIFNRISTSLKTKIKN